MSSYTKSRSRQTGSLKVGRRAFAKVSAVEGIRLSSRVEADFQDFGRRGLSAAERRAALLRKYGREG